MQVKRKGQYCILCPGSDLGVFQVSQRIDEALHALKSDGNCNICVDLSTAPIIDSSVIGTLVKFYREMKSDDGELVIISARNAAIEAMIKMHLDHVIRFVNSVEDLR